MRATRSIRATRATRAERAAAAGPGGDPGVFGPGSVTWQLHGDPVMWIGGVRALYLQALHPAAIRGVMANSDFRKDAWGRLLRTASFVGTLTYGTTKAAEAAGARVRKIHRLLGVDDPELLLWVHCAEIDSYLHVVRRSGIPLTDAQADRYVDEQRVAARLVGLDPDEVPGTSDGLRRYFDAVRPALAAGRTRGWSTTSCARRPSRPRSCPRARHSGGAWRHSRTTPCPRTPTSCTGAPRPRRRP